MIRRLLIANRGEIAARILRTCRRLGVEAVTVYSQADRDARYLRDAFASVAIGPAPASLSYLKGEALIRAALDTGCDGVHPGYGFLSENPDFAETVEEAGLIFVGPAPHTIRQMGDKANAKVMMADAGVPVIPGSSQASDDIATIARHVREIGYPTLLKPVAGGGGKGMAVIESGDGREAIESAIRTAGASFGDGRLLVERRLKNPRHVEVQIFGNGCGKVVHLFERECSLQRRHQKIVEEAPAANLSEELREKILAAAVRGAQALRYRNAGTFEFILCPDGSFYFIEANTRLQVEHPVTEEITGIDLVEWQLRVAAGEPLPLTQDAIERSGHAVECRVYAEDPAADFRPAPGRITQLRWPEAARIESAVERGSFISSHYDPMIAKIIVRAGERGAALQAMQTAIQNTAILGVTTNLGLLSGVLECLERRTADIDTNFIEANILDLLPKLDDAHVLCAAAAAVILCSRPENTERASPWTSGIEGRFADRIAIDGDAPLGRIALSLGSRHQTLGLRACTANELIFILDKDAGASGLRRVTGRSDGKFAEGRVGTWHWHAVVNPLTVDVVVGGTRFEVRRAAQADLIEAGDSTTVVSPMPGLVVSVNVAPGSRVAKGDVLFVIEAMKFENSVVAGCDGVIAEIACALGDQVKAGQLLARFAEIDGGEAQASPVESSM